MISLRNVSFSYNGGPSVLLGVNLEIAEGQYIGLIGANGSGKTTLACHLNGLLLPREGSVQVDGLDTAHPPSRALIRARVGMVFQNPDSQIVGMTVAEDIAFGPGNLGLPPHEIKRRVREAMETCGLTPLADRPPHTLSGGEKRLVSIGGILAMEPKYIVFDEPAAYLDGSGRATVLKLMERLHRRGMTIIHITHDLADLIGAERILLMDRGDIVVDAPPPAVFAYLLSHPEMGLTPPPISVLSHRLREAGIPIRADLAAVEEAARELQTLWGCRS